MQPRDAALLFSLLVLTVAPTERAEEHVLPFPPEELGLSVSILQLRAHLPLLLTLLELTYPPELEARELCRCFHSLFDHPIPLMMMMMMNSLTLTMTVARLQLHSMLLLLLLLPCSTSSRVSTPGASDSPPDSSGALSPGAANILLFDDDDIADDDDERARHE